MTSSNISSGYVPDGTILKQQAKRLRAHLASDGQTISHAQALETVAHQYGYKDWNTLSVASLEQSQARAGQSDMSNHFQVGNWVKGAFMGKPFTGEILGVQLHVSGSYGLTIRFDEPVDVVEFESFSSMRSRVNVQVNGSGVSPKKRSDGTPHLVLH